MKKSRWALCGLILLVILLCIGYFATPIRPAIAQAAANGYIESHYQQYDFAPAEIVSTGFHEYRALKWVSGYGAQSTKGLFTVHVELNGWLPFLVEDSKLWEIKDGESILVAP